MTPPDAYRYGDDQFDPAHVIARAKAAIARERAAAERRRRNPDDLEDPDAA